MNKEPFAPEQTFLKEALENQKDLSQAFWRKECFRLNNREINFCGVRHIPETFEKYRREIEQAIDTASLVILEGAPQASGLLTDETITEIARWLSENSPRHRNKTIISLKEDIRQAFTNDRGVQFYSEVERIVADKNQPLIVVDPERAQEATAEKLAKIDGQVLLSKIIMGLGGTAGLGVGLHELTKISQSRKEKPESYKLDRRAFFKTMAGVIGALISSSSLGSFFAGVINERPDGSWRGRKENPLGFMLYQLSDYRNVVIAKGLEIVTKGDDYGDGPISLIYGDSHTSAVRYYVENSIERELKYKAYDLSYGRVVKPTIHLYQFDKNSQVWQESEIVPIN